MNIETNLVDQVCLEERFRKQAAAHDADIFTLLLFYSSNKLGNIVRGDCEIPGRTRFQRARKHISLHPGIRAAPMAASNRNLVGPSSHHDGVKRLEVVGHDFSDFITPHEPIDSIILSSEIVVEAIGTTKNNLAHLFPFDVAASITQRWRLRRSRVRELLPRARRLRRSMAGRFRWLRSTPRCG